MSDQKKKKIQTSLDFLTLGYDPWIVKLDFTLA